jgi:2-polyprenyl-3-methyl-5-hydroxy-6-metoxy-1,4-benzoquinol methylase
LHGPSDKAGRSYWDHVWEGQEIPPAFSPGRKTRHNYADQAFHEAFARLFAGTDQSGKRLLEIGAARSAWLPYFAKAFGFSVTGIDYSALGCAQARAVLAKAGVDGEVVLADFFAPPDEMLAAFDVVISFGVIEHFDDTAATVAALSRFLRPGGLMITIVPNLSGVGGVLQKRLCRAIYDVHMRLDRRSLRAAHEASGLSVRACRYFIGGGFTTMNMSCRSGSRHYWAFSRIPTTLAMPFLLLERLNVRVRPNRLTSPYLICLAQRPS